eukprot:TRINITY_DN10761_c0_g1_i5.p1 TRINITY_DN10761_c0_g1~~TRINITY_DN10761_c0_g1_i5.p1  ORF type:complete len:242 (+),score=40.46 TRINITY_DN10761_c0_g1_i5:89-814(+)
MCIRDRFCIATTIKCFAIPRFRTSLPLIAIYVCFHIAIVGTFLTMLNVFRNFALDLFYYIANYSAALAKDFFLLIFTSRILGVVANWEKRNKFPRIAITIIWVILPLHLVGFLTTGGDEFKLPFYLALVEIPIVLLYAYSCIKILPHFRNNYLYSQSSHLKWLLITIIYMIFGMECKIFLNLLQFLYPEFLRRSVTEMQRLCVMMVGRVVTALIPPVLMSYCLLKLTQQEVANTDDELDQY